MAYKSDCQESQRESEERKHYCLILKAQKPSHGGVAQLGEHLPCKQGVKSSNLSVSIVKSQRDFTLEIL